MNNARSGEERDKDAIPQKVLSFVEAANLGETPSRGGKRNLVQLCSHKRKMSALMMRANHVSTRSAVYRLIYAHRICIKTARRCTSFRAASCAHRKVKAPPAKLVLRVKYTVKCVNVQRSCTSSVILRRKKYVNTTGAVKGCCLLAIHQGNTYFRKLVRIRKRNLRRREMIVFFSFESKLVRYISLTGKTLKS